MSLHLILSWSCLNSSFSWLLFHFILHPSVSPEPDFLFWEDFPLAAWLTSVPISLIALTCFPAYLMSQFFCQIVAFLSAQDTPDNFLNLIELLVLNLYAWSDLIWSPGLTSRPIELIYSDLILLPYFSPSCIVFLCLWHRCLLEI